MMRSPPGGVQGAPQINAQTPRECVSCKLHFTLFWEERRMKAGIQKIAIHTDKLVPHQWPKRRSYLSQSSPQFCESPSVYSLALSHPSCLLSTLPMTVSGLLAQYMWRARSPSSEDKKERSLNPVSSRTFQKSGSFRYIYANPVSDNNAYTHGEPIMCQDPRDLV